MNILTSCLSGALACALAAGVFSTAMAAPVAVPAASATEPALFHQAQYDGRRGARENDRNGRFERRGNSVYFNNQRGYHERRPGYRQHNGFWFPPAAFIAGAIVGGAMNDLQHRSAHPTYRMSGEHVAWCSDHWRSYRASDNTYQPNSGARRVCTSPFN